MSIYQLIIDLSEQHSRFEDGGCSDLLKFDLDKKNIKNKSTVIIMNGEVGSGEIKLKNGKTYNSDVPLISASDLQSMGIDDCSKNPYEVIETLYHNYKYSVQGERSQFLRQNFYALKNDDLNFEQLLNNMARAKALYMLEAYIILASLSKWIKWENEKQFFKTMNDQDLIIYKSWIQ